MGARSRQGRPVQILLLRSFARAAVFNVVVADPQPTTLPAHNRPDTMSGTGARYARSEARSASRLPKAERRSDEILQAVGLSDKAHAYARSLSGGMRRRLLVAKAMVHSPQVLVLDEPSAGVDVDLRRQLWTHVRDMNRRGTTVLLTTHYLEEAETLCDTIAIINHGRLIACDPTERLLARIDSKQMTVTLDADLSTLPTNLHSFNAELRGSRHVVFSYAPSRINSGQILAAIDAAGLCITDLATREAELEDIFLHLTQKPDLEAG